MFKCSSNSSNLWKGITENAKFINAGAQKAVGNGRETLFWDHKWAINQPLNEVAIKDIPTAIQGATVSEMWDEQLGWNWDLFAKYLPISALKKIQSISLVNDAHCEDSFFWNKSPNGEFTLKSALSIIHESSEVEEHPKWKIIWEAKAQNRVKFFLWLAMHNRLLCNEIRAQRHLTSDPSCPLCHANIESIMHALRDCPHARKIWDKLCPSSRKQEFFEDIDVQGWLQKNLLSSSISGEDTWLYAFPLAVWWIWKWRCQKIFKSWMDVPSDQINFLSHKISEAKSALTKNNLLALLKIQKQEIFVRWSAPPYEWMALNTDGAAKGCPGQAGGGGIFRSHRGECCGFFSINLGICTAIHAEFMAIYRGLVIAWDNGIKKLDVRVDNQPCVHILNYNNNYDGPSKQIVKKCKEMIERKEWIVTIHHTYREANRAADWLANKGATQQDDLILHNTPPYALAQIIHEDLLGVAWSRTITM